MTLDGKILRGIFEHERLKCAIIRANQGNIQNLADLRQSMNTNLKFNQYSSLFTRHHIISVKFYKM